MTPFYDIPGTGKSMVTEIDWGSEGRHWKMTVQRCRVSSWSDENIMKLITVKVEQLCGCTEYH